MIYLLLLFDFDFIYYANKSAFYQMAMFFKGKSPILGDLDNTMQEIVSSESMNNACSCNSGPSLEHDSSDTSFKLG
jgi:hypothetical protein